MFADNVFKTDFTQPTKFRLHKSIGDSQIVSSYSLSVDDPKQREFGRQRVHDHRQVSLPNLGPKK